MTRRLLLILGVVLAMGFAGAGAVFTQSTLHVPRQTTVAAGARVEVRATDGAQMVASWFARPGGRCVVILHGISDSRASSAGFAPMFLEQGYSVLAPDSRAHGESGGDIVTYGLLEKHDVIAWAHWMREHSCGQLYGLGESLGAAVLIQAVALEPVFTAIVAESSYADLQDAAEVRLRHMLPLPAGIGRPLAWLTAVNGKLYARIAYGLDLGAASPLEAIRQSRTPTLLIHGLADDQTPPEHSQRLAAANPHYAELWLVPGGRHSSALAADPAVYRKRVLTFFSRWI